MKLRFKITETIFIKFVLNEQYSSYLTDPCSVTILLQHLQATVIDYMYNNLLEILLELPMQVKTEPPPPSPLEFPLTFLGVRMDISRTAHYGLLHHCLNGSAFLHFIQHAVQ